MFNNLASDRSVTLSSKIYPEQPQVHVVPLHGWLQFRVSLKFDPFCVDIEVIIAVGVSTYPVHVRVALQQLCSISVRNILYFE